MKKLLTIFLDRFGWFGFVRLVFYPLTTFLTTPVRLIKTLVSCRVLIGANQSDYNHFIPFNGLDTLFYRVCALSLKRFGRNGVCPYMGLGNFPLSRWFYHSTISLSLYRWSSCLCLLFGMFVWAFSHLLWLSHAELFWVLLVIFMAIFSTTFYANTFALQNYNVLGWMFFSAGLYGIFSKKFIISCIAWFLASFASFTVVFIAAIISLVYALVNTKPAYILAFMPVALILLQRLWSLFVNKDIKNSFLNILKGIGMYRKNIKYKIILSPKDILISLYFLILYIQFFVVFYLVSANISIIFLTGLILFVVNSTYIRFADVQSVQMCMFSIATAQVLQTSHPFLLVSYWLLISPLPFMLPFPFMRNVLDTVPNLSPFYIRRLVDGMESFLSPVAAGKRILMAFDDPNNLYSGIFNGYRALVQLPLYVAAKNRVHFMPDWWGVFDLNWPSAPGFWGRSKESVLENIVKWRPDYIVIYQTVRTNLDSKWEEIGFKVLNKFSWLDYAKDLRGTQPYLYEAPDWWLLEIPKNLNSFKNDPMEISTLTI